MKRILYFAYGSNISEDRLEFRVGKVISVRDYILNGYELLFNCDGFANIAPRQGSQVQGYLYELTPIQLGMLDRYEGFYYKEFFDIPSTEFVNHIAVVYVGLPKFTDNSKFALLPRLDYINTILQGCLEKGLTDTYNKVLEFKEKNYKLKKGNKFKKLVS